VFEELILSHRSEIRSYLDRLKELQGIVWTRARDMVVCHTDLHGGNLLVDSQGNLYILDWEGAMLSPPEQDLFFFAGEDTFWDLFWPNYQHEYGAARLDVETLGFYYYRCGLEDLAEWIQRFLYVDQDDEQDRNALHGAAETLADLPNVGTTLGKIVAHIEN
jgi:thiamine kinase-like enzyme